MLNVKNLTDTMSRMELPQLQQYAALHKNDPYIVTLALSIANQKKQMKAGQAGQAGMQPQPKVVDQQISNMAAVDPMGNVTGAQMLPEDTGIGKLPAQNMRRMAGGGIVAFDEGGEVPGYADGVFVGQGFNQNPLVPPPTQNRNALIANRSAEIATQATQDELKRIESQLQNMQPSPQRDFLENRKRALLSNASAPVAAPAASAPPTAPPSAPALPPNATQAISGLPSVAPLAPPPAAPKPPSSEDVYMAGIEKLLKSSQTSGGAGSGLNPRKYDVTAPQLANATPKDMADRLAAAMGPNPTESPLAGQQAEVNRANVATRQQYADDLAEQFKNQGEAFKGTLEKLTAKEARVQSMEDKQLGMSMFEAGLAMMSGDSPYAMVNIGKGAQVGTKKYMEIQNQVESARDKIDDAKMKIEEFRRNEANMNARELRLAKKDVNDAVSAGAQASLNLMREQYGLKHNEGLAFVNNSYMLDRFNAEQKTNVALHNQSTAAGIDTARAQMANASNIANNQLKAHLGLAALEAKYKADNPAAGSLGFFKQLGDGDAVKGLEIYNKSGTESKGINAFALEALKDPSLLPRLEAGSAQDRQLAASIKQHMQGMMLQPQTKPADVNRP
jgi:hypothetical protein